MEIGSTGLSTDVPFLTGESIPVCRIKGDLNRCRLSDPVEIICRMYFLENRGCGSKESPESFNNRSVRFSNTTPRSMWRILCL